MGFENFENVADSTRRDARRSRKTLRLDRQFIGQPTSDCPTVVAQSGGPETVMHEESSFEAKLVHEGHPEERHVHQP
jgi:hypothetical protein